MNQDDLATMNLTVNLTTVPPIAIGGVSVLPMFGAGIFIDAFSQVIK